MSKLTSLKLSKVGSISKNLSRSLTRSMSGVFHKSENVIVSVFRGITVGSILQIYRFYILKQLSAVISTYMWSNVDIELYISFP